MHTWSKRIAKWYIGRTLFLSVVFSWDIHAAVVLANEHNGKVVVGGPAVTLNPGAFDGVATVSNEPPQGIEPILFHNPLATFTTRGCPNRCGFCAVPKIEPEYKELSVFRPAPTLCDNNFLAASVAHQVRVISAIQHFPLVDFNQGLDASLFDDAAADRLSHLRLQARFAFDHVSEAQVVSDAIKRCRERTTKNIRVYVLIGFNDTPEEALYRMELVRRLKCDPIPMRYQPLTADKKNAYIHPAWTSRELLGMVKYYFRLSYWGGTPYGEWMERNIPEEKEQCSLFDIAGGE
ncbi:MAG: hypothetical protein WC905_02620 [Patescibacteria group bacterium]